MAATGALHPGDLVWTEGMAQWVPAQTIPDLFMVAAPMQPVAFAGGPYANPGILGYHTPQITAQNYAGFWIRVGAAFIDGLIVGAVNFGVGLVIGLIMLGPHTTKQSALAADGMSTVVGYIIGWLYEALQESSAAQATIGKRALGLRVTNLAGERISFGRATGRHFAKFLSGLILGIGFLMVAFTEKKQGLHDQIAGTLVLRN